MKNVRFFQCKFKGVVNASPEIDVFVLRRDSFQKLDEIESIIKERDDIIVLWFSWETTRRERFEFSTTIEDHRGYFTCMRSMTDQIANDPIHFEFCILQEGTPVFVYDFTRNDGSRNYVVYLKDGIPRTELCLWAEDLETFVIPA